MQEKEVWKDVKDYEGLYQVSNLGRVKSIDRVVKTTKGQRTYPTKVLKPCYDGFGYCVYGLSKNGKVKNKRGHQLVAINFMNHTPNGLKVVIDHKDDDPTNNTLENLQLVSHRYNISKGSIGKSSSKYTGVTWHKHRKMWMVGITYNKQHYHLGYYNSEDEAGNLYLEKLKELSNA